MNNRQLAEKLNSLAYAIDNYGPQTTEAWQQGVKLVGHVYGVDSVALTRWLEAKGESDKAAWNRVMQISVRTKPKCSRPKPDKGKDYCNSPAEFLRGVAERLKAGAGRPRDGVVTRRREIVKRHIRLNADKIIEILEQNRIKGVKPGTVRNDKYRIRQAGIID